MKHIATLTRAFPREARVEQSLYMTLFWEIPLERIIFIAQLIKPDKVPDWRRISIL